MNKVAHVILWGRHIATVYWDAKLRAATFAWERAFALAAPVDPAPMIMPIAPGQTDPDAVYAFRDLSFDTFKGLPGFIGDSLATGFGETVVDRWFVERGRDPRAVTAVERLCSLGGRGLGALSFEPLDCAPTVEAQPLEIETLVEISNEVLAKQQPCERALEKSSALETLVQVGTSARGACAKALVGWNQATGEMCSGQAEVPEGFEHWLLKLDGVATRADGSLTLGHGHGRIEYAYHLMARAAGIEVSDFRIHEENGRAHFMTRRFDRPTRTKKLHMLSWCGLRHHDFRSAGGYAYEELLQTCFELGLGTKAVREAYRRMVFNLVARSQDDHTGKFSFLMDQSGRWSLAPAYDVGFTYDPTSDRTAKHNITANGKRDAFVQEDLLAVARSSRLRNAQAVFAEVKDAINQWSLFAEQAGLSGGISSAIGDQFRCNLLG